jgi:hypothetical protein
VRGVYVGACCVCGCVLCMWVRGVYVGAWCVCGCVVCMWVRVVYVGACCVCGCVVCMWVRGVYVHVGLLLWRFRIHVQLVQQVCKECVYCV